MDGRAFAFAGSGGMCGHTAPPESGPQGDRGNGTANTRRTLSTGQPDEARGKGHTVSLVSRLFVRHFGSPLEPILLLLP